jgi:hypothetical protein
MLRRSIARRLETIAYLLRYWNFESISLQRRVWELSVPQRLHCLRARHLPGRPVTRPLFAAAGGIRILGHLGLDDFMARRPGWERSTPEGGATWVHIGANLGATNGELYVQSASDGLRQLAGIELGCAGRAPDAAAPKTLVPSGETRDIHRRAEDISPLSAATDCSICPRIAGRTRWTQTS